MTILTREMLSNWLDSLAKERTLIAPKDVSGVLLYRPVQKSTEVVMDYVRPVMSIKDAFFPATERLLTIEKTEQTVELQETLPEGEQIIFGTRSCDARGLIALDALFIDTDPVDEYYVRRRKNTTIIGLACTKMADTCFCTSTGGAPDDTTGMDVMLYPVDGAYQVQVLTEKGEKIVNREWLIESDEWKSSQSFTIREIPIPDSNNWPTHFEDEFWPAMSERCLSCRICAYVCPTCRCFDVRDETIPSDNGNNKFERIRCWDSCAGMVYRRIAGGHNPREAKGERLRNRFMCKFYYYPDR
jgi:sulfhydrogenase subunit beta (sulfur reductase)